MVNMGIYKSIKINIGRVMRNSEMLKLVPDHLKTKNMCKHKVRKLPSVTVGCSILKEVKLVRTR